MRSASSLSHIAATNNTTFSTCKIVNTVMVVSIQRTFVNPIGTLFCPFGFGCFNVFYISLHCFVEHNSLPLWCSSIPQCKYKLCLVYIQTKSKLFLGTFYK